MAITYPRSAEQFLAEIDEIVQRFQSASGGMAEGVALEEAIGRLRKLGFTAGQAMHLLRNAQQRRELRKP